jgi:hypothetical protein
VIRVGVGGDEAVERSHAPTAQEIDHFGAGLGLSTVHEVVLAAGLDEDRGALPHVL